MSRSRVLSARAAVLACALAAPMTGAAQATPAPSMDALVARRGALIARARSLSEEVRRLEAAAADSGLDVEARAGAFRLRTTGALQEAAAAALARAVDTARAVIGADVDSLAGRLTLTLRENRATARYGWSPFVGTTVTPAVSRITSTTLDGVFDGTHLAGVVLSYPVDREELAANLLMLLERAAARRLPANLDSWLNHRLPLGAARTGIDATLYRALATDDAAVVRRCAAGDRASCRLGFALDSVPANRVSAWYDPSDLPTLAGTAGDGGQRSWMYRTLNAVEQHECTVERDPAACERMVALLPAEAFRIPMPDAARASLIRVALQTGGSTAIGRLRASDTKTLAAQLAAAAGISPDALLDRWMQQVIAARPASPLPNATFVLASLACIAVCVAWAVRGQPWK